MAISWIHLLYRNILIYKDRYRVRDNKVWIMYSNSTVKSFDTNFTQKLMPYIIDRK